MQSSWALLFGVTILMFGSATPVTGVKASPVPAPGHLSPERTLAIVVHPSNPVENLTMAELRRVFLGEEGHWPDGQRITLVMMEVGEPERKAVLQQICRMNESDYRKSILHRLYTGELLVSPKTLSNPTHVRGFVFNVPGAIGYLRAVDVNESVKVVRIDGHLPTDDGYPLHLDPPPGPQ
jgi:phosphate transport system substrate-binding protein